MGKFFAVRTRKERNTRDVNHAGKMDDDIRIAFLSNTIVLKSYDGCDQKFLIT